MLMIVTMAMALFALACVMVARQAAHAADAPADFMGYGDRPLPKKPAAAAPAVARKPAASTVTLKVPDPKCACQFARLIAGKTYEPEAAPKLPLAGCGVIECRCRFVATTDRRGKVRRDKEERRDMIRFETKSGRREVGGDRRKSNTRWTGPR